MFRVLIVFWVVCTVFFGAAPDPVMGKNGMVAADSELASLAGVEILKKGGNAFDSAVATALALGVVHPHSSGIGGGAFAVYHHASSRETRALDSREIAPQKISMELYRPGGKLDRNLSRVGGLAVAVPGELKGLRYLHKRFGVLPWTDVVEPARRLAVQGFPVSHYLAHVLKKFRKTFEVSAYLKRTFYPGGRLLRPGDILRQPNLGRALELIGKNGVREFYSGTIAKALVQTISKSGGVITHQDLDSIQPRLLRPLKGNYRGREIYTMPSPSSGGLVLLQMLGVLEHFPLHEWGHNASKTLHVISETMKHAYANRARYMGDDRFVEIPVSELLSKSTLEKLARGLSMDKTRPREAYGTHFVDDDHGTTHFSVMDREGNTVAMTSTINTFFGSLLVVEEFGIVLNNEMDDFSLAPGVPNAYGLIGSEANAIVPGKKPLSSMTPAIVFQGGHPVLALGGSGGPRIISGVFQVLMNVIDHSMQVQAAVNAPRIHHQWVPETLDVEPEIPRDVRENLLKKGHEIKDLKARNVIQAVELKENWFQGASDPRKKGRAAGY